jgi:hypothetical protein
MNSEIQARGARRLAKYLLDGTISAHNACGWRSEIRPGDQLGDQLNSLAAGARGPRGVGEHRRARAPRGVGEDRRLSALDSVTGRAVGSTAGARQGASIANRGGSGAHHLDRRCIDRRRVSDLHPTGCSDRARPAPVRTHTRHRSDLGSPQVRHRCFACAALRISPERSSPWSTRPRRCGRSATTTGRAASRWVVAHGRSVTGGDCTLSYTRTANTAGASLTCALSAWAPTTRAGQFTFRSRSHRA